MKGQVGEFLAGFRGPAVSQIYSSSTPCIEDEGVQLSVS